MCCINLSQLLCMGYGSWEGNKEKNEQRINEWYTAKITSKPNRILKKKKKIILYRQLWNNSENTDRHL